MTWAQWLAEAHAIRKKEEEALSVQTEILKAQARIFRDTLIGVLGLGHFAPADAPSTPESPAFLPAAFLFSNHHLLKVAYEEKTKSDSTSAAVNDAEFEIFSQKLASGDVGDLDPIILGQTPHGDIAKVVEERHLAATLKLLGVKPRSADAPTAHHIGREPAGVTVTFEDDA